MTIAERKKKRDWFWFWYVAVIAAIVLPWFLSPGYLFFTDFVWGPHLRLDWSSAPIWKNIFFWILSLVLPTSLVQKVFIASTLVVVLLGGRKLASSILKDRRLVLLVSIFVLINPFIYDRLNYGQINLVAAFGLFCLAMGFLLDYPRRGWSQMLWAGLFAGMSVRLSPHFIFFIMLMALCCFVAMVWKQRSWRVVGHFALLAAVLVALNTVWLAKSFIGSDGGDDYTQATIAVISHQDLEAFKTSGETDGEALLNVMLMSGFWGKDQYRYLDLTAVDSSWGRSFFLLLPLLIWGVYVGLRQRESRTLTIGLLVTLVTAVILAVGIRLPVAREITVWLFDNVPLYKGLRETQKWVAVVTVIYAIFLSLGFRELFRIRLIETNRTASQLFLAGVIIMQAPLMLWGLGGQAKSTPYPDDWYQADKKIVEASGCESQTLFLPWHLYMSFGWTGKIVASPASTFFTCPTTKGSNMEWGGIDDESRSDLSADVQDWISNQGNLDSPFFDDLNIGYVILAKEIDWQSYDWLDELPDVHLIEEWPTLKLYEVTK